MLKCWLLKKTTNLQIEREVYFQVEKSEHTEDIEVQNL